MKWLPIVTAPKDGTRILTYSVVPILNEDTGITETVSSISVAYFILGEWMEYPAPPRFVRGQRHTHWMPLPSPPEEIK